MNEPFGLQESDLWAIRGVLALYPQVDKAILYGSRAKGNYKTGSDIDLTLCGGQELTPAVLRRIMADIDELLLPYTFDLSILERIEDAEVLAQIRRVDVPFYDKGKTEKR
jgi:predicted nucleotidyltransferase